MEADIIWQALNAQYKTVWRWVFDARHRRLKAALNRPSR